MAHDPKSRNVHILTPAGYQGRIARSDEQLAAIEHLRAEGSYADAARFHIENILAAIEGLQSTGIPVDRLKTCHRAFHSLLPQHDGIEVNLAIADESLDADHQYEYSMLTTNPMHHRKALMGIQINVLHPLAKDLRKYTETARYIKPLRAFSACINREMRSLDDALKRLEGAHLRYMEPATKGRER